MVSDRPTLSKRPHLACLRPQHGDHLCTGPDLVERTGRKCTLVGASGPCDCHGRRPAKTVLWMLLEPSLRETCLRHVTGSVPGIIFARRTNAQAVEVAEPPLLLSRPLLRDAAERAMSRVRHGVDVPWGTSGVLKDVGPQRKDCFELLYHPVVLRWPLQVPCLLSRRHTQRFGPSPDSVLSSRVVDHGCSVDKNIFARIVAINKLALISYVK